MWLEFREISPLSVEVALFNAQGQILQEIHYGPYQRMIRLEPGDLNTGIYFVRIKRGNLIRNLKITKMK
jgi:hypothetical protein